MAEEKKEVAKKFESIVAEIEKMSVLDLSELVTILENKFNVSASAGMMAPMAAAPTAGAGADEAVEEKTEFTVELTAVGDKKIQVIKAVRTITGLGLKESKDIVDSAVSAPQKIKENIKKEEAEEAKKVLEEAGATVTLR